MKKIIISAAIIVILAAGVIVVWLATQSGSVSVKQTIEIKANPQKVFDIVSNLRTWNLWSPWTAIDPKSETKITGMGTEPGNTLAWKGELIGSGIITNMQTDQNKIIKQSVKFLEPFKSDATTSFQIEPTSDGVIVIWQMKSEMPFFMRFMTKQMSAYLASDFDRGLKMLKDLAETGDVASKVLIKGAGQFDGTLYVGKKIFCTKDQVGPTMNATLYEVNNWLIASSSFPGEAISVYHRFDSESDSCIYTAGYTISNTQKFFPYSDVVLDSIPKCDVMKVTFYGDYKHLDNAWMAGYAYMQHNRIKPDKTIPPFEVYMNDPAFFPNPNDWVTEVYIPILK
jgi:effector-binding domain-containing protein